MGGLSPHRPGAPTPGVSEIRRLAAECRSSSLCRHCFWFSSNGGWCSGCDRDCHRRCLKRSCSLDCDRCSGGRHATTPGCCGRTVVKWRAWRSRLEEILHHPVSSYIPAPVPIRCRLIPVIYGQVRHLRLPEQFPEIDTWAAPIHKVASRKGRFRSSDLKDYLGLPADRKLILSTCAPDDFQEMLWEKGPRMAYEDHGIDFWFPAHFSIYDDDGKLYQFLNAKRQQIHAVWTRSQFVWFRLGTSIPVDFLRPIRQAPAVLVSTQQAFSRRSREIAAREVRIADRWFPPETRFFQIGDAVRLPLSESRVRFQVNTRWLLLGLKGRDLKNRPRPELPTAGLLSENLRAVLANVQPSESQASPLSQGSEEGGA